MTVNNTIITPETIALTRNHFIDICNACILGATNGDFRVNDLTKYVAWQQRCISSMRNGEMIVRLHFCSAHYGCKLAIVLQFSPNLYKAIL